MRRDLHVMEQICYLGDQELRNSPAPLHSAAPRDAARSSRALAASQFVAVMEPYWTTTLRRVATMATWQAIVEPFGITVFGSSIKRVPPDLVSLRFAVSRLDENPKMAFRQTREDAATVMAFLSDTGVQDLQSSNIVLHETHRFIGGEQRFIGYTAKIAFHLVLHRLDAMEKVITGVVEAGVNEFTSVDYQTSRLQEIREEVRREAIDAARKKAENYCRAAGVSLGPVKHIEDVNPDILNRVGEGHVQREPLAMEDISSEAIDPGSIQVAGTVFVSYGIAEEKAGQRNR
jgi:uncharacterized protein YggE